MDAKTVCLGVLTLGDSTGYDIRKKVEDTFGHFLDVSLGSIYPALAELNREGLVTCERVAQDTRPDKKVYSLTEAGQSTFVQAMIATPSRHRIRSEFLALCFFAHHLPAWRVREALDKTINECQCFLDHADDWVEEMGAIGGPGAIFLADYGRTTLKAEIDFLRANRERLIAVGVGDPNAAAPGASGDPAVMPVEGGR